MFQNLTPTFEETVKPSLSERNVQRVVNEWELDAYLSQGWRYVAILPSGRIVVGS